MENKQPTNDQYNCEAAGDVKQIAQDYLYLKRIVGGKIAVLLLKILKGVG